MINNYYLKDFYLAFVLAQKFKVWIPYNACDSLFGWKRVFVRDEWFFSVRVSLVNDLFDFKSKQ